jgi:predicted lipoprotein with Yx(FWY)xxD motif
MLTGHGETSIVQELTLIRRNRIAWPAAIAASALLFAACSNAGTGGTTAPTTTATQPPATAGATAGASAAAEAYEVELGDSDKYGQFLTDEDGKTLYLFTPDTATTSNCNEGCIESWPAFTIESDETVKGGDGVTGTFGTITRADGTMQVTYGGHPLYYYGADKAAGDTNGEGLFNKWYLVGADGNAVMGGADSSGGKGSY